MVVDSAYIDNVLIKKTVKMNNAIIWITNKSYHLSEVVLLSQPEIFCNRLSKSFVYPNANEAKNLFIDYVDKKSCYGKVAANECEIFKTATYNVLYVN